MAPTALARDTLAGMRDLVKPTPARVVAWALALVALVSPVLLYVQFEATGEPDMLAVVLWLVVPTTIAGFVISWGLTDMPPVLDSGMSKRSLRWADNAQRGLLDAVVVVVIIFLGTFVMQLVISITTGDDWDELFVGPLLIAVVGAFPVFAAMLLSLMVVMPLRAIGSYLVARISGGRADSSRPAFAVLLLLIIPLGVTAVAAGYTLPAGSGTRGNGVVGLVLLGQLFFTVHGTPQEQLFAWIARVLIVLLVVDIVWLARIANRRRRNALHGNAGQS